MGGKIYQKSIRIGPEGHRKSDGQKECVLEAAGGALAPTGRAATDSEVVQRGANVAKNPLQGAPGPPPFREKRALYNTQSPMLHVIILPAGLKIKRMLKKSGPYRSYA